MLKISTAFCGSANFTRLSLPLCLAILPFTFVASAAVPIRVTEAEFSTYLTMRVGDLGNPGVWYTNFNSLVGSSPISDYMEDVEPSYPSPGWILAGATSQWFQVSTRTSEGPRIGSSHAYGICDITFAPTSAEVADVILERQLGGQADFWSSGFVSLVDLTLNQPLWYCDWGNYLVTYGRPEPDLSYEIRESFPFGLGTMSLIQSTEFSEDHLYKLVLLAGCDANGDAESVILNVLGLEIIPEPRVVALLGIGSLALMVRRLRR